MTFYGSENQTKILSQNLQAQNYLLSDTLQILWTPLTTPHPPTHFNRLQPYWLTFCSSNTRSLSFCLKALALTLLSALHKIGSFSQVCSKVTFIERPFLTTITKQALPNSLYHILLFISFSILTWIYKNLILSIVYILWWNITTVRLYKSKDHAL